MTQTRSVYEVKNGLIHRCPPLVVVEDDMMCCHLPLVALVPLALHREWICTMSRRRQSSKTMDSQAAHQDTPLTVSLLQRRLHKVLGRLQDSPSEPKPRHRQSVSRFLPLAQNVGPRLPLAFLIVTERFADPWHRKDLALVAPTSEISEFYMSAKKPNLHCANLTCAKGNGSAISLVSPCV